MNLFVYGTLLVPEIWGLVTGEKPLKAETARLTGYFIKRVRGGDFPGIAKGIDTDFVAGKLIRDLSPPTIAKLDAYEDSFYERLPVAVTLDSTEKTSAEAYIIPEGHTSKVLSDKPWSLEWFLGNACEEYISRMKGFR